MVSRNRFGRFIPSNMDPFDPRAVFDLPAAPVQIPTSWPNVVAQVDEVDRPLMSFFTWQVCLNPFGKRYAKTTVRIGGRKVGVYMHRIIACRVARPPTAGHTIVDHLDGDSLNNRRRNLRWATPSENSANRHGLASRQTDFLGELVPMRADHPANPCTAIFAVLSNRIEGFQP